MYLKRRLKTFSGTQVSGVSLLLDREDSFLTNFTVTSAAGSAELVVEAKACMKYIDAELHPVIGQAVAQMQQVLQNENTGDDGTTAVAALLHFEAFFSGTGKWDAMLNTLSNTDSLPATWDQNDTALLSIADVDLSWFQTQSIVTLSQAKLVLQHVVLPNSAAYGIIHPEGNHERLLSQIVWALAVTRAASIPPAFKEDSVAICPLFHAMPHSADGYVVQHATAKLANVIGQTRMVVKSYSIPLPKKPGGPVFVKRVDESDICAHELFYLFGQVAPKSMACIPIKVTVPGLPPKPPALTVLRRSAMVAGGLIPGESAKPHALVYNLSPMKPPPMQMLRLLRLSSLQYNDVE